MAAALPHELHIWQEYLALADRNELLGTLPPTLEADLRSFLADDSVRGSVAYLTPWLTFLDVSATPGTASTAAPFDTAAEFHTLHNAGVSPTCGSSTRSGPRPPRPPPPRTRRH